MRILHLVRNLEVGGLERFVVDLATEQVAQGHSVGIMSITPPKHTQIAVPQGIRLHTMGKVAARFKLLRFNSVSHIAKATPYEVVHAHNTLALTNTEGVTGQPVVFTKHGMDFVSGKQARVYTLPAIAVCVSAQILEEYLRLFPEMQNELLLVQNGVHTRDAYRKNGVSREDLGIQESRLVLVTVGRLVKEKGLDLLLDSFLQLEPSALGQLHWLVLGDGPERASLEQRVSVEGLAEHVTFAGMRDDVQDILPLCDVYLMPSRMEGLPMALLEAAAAGLPCAVSNVGGMPDVIIDDVTGWVLPSDDTGPWIDLLFSLASRRHALTEMGQRARSVVEERFGMSQCARQYTAAYNRVLGDI